MSKKKLIKTFNIDTKSKVPTLAPDSLITVRAAKKYDCVPFGSDNLFPYAIAALNRKSAVHRGILNKKTAFITGHGFNANDNNLKDWIKSVNAQGESLTDVASKVFYDHLADGNGYIEFITNKDNTFLNVEHHDHTTVRISQDKEGFVIKSNWRTKKGDKSYLPKYPFFQEDENGLLRSMIHIKSYEPEFVNYGVMDWIAGLDASAIAYKTSKWNIARLDNSFQSSGVMMISGQFNDEEEGMQLQEDLEETYSGEGNQGKIFVIVSDLDKDSSKFIPIDQKFEGDWTSLSKEATNELIVAHSWFRSLMSLGDNTGFETNRIITEYDMALIDTIEPKQRLFLRPLSQAIETILKYDVDDFKFINKPPVPREIDNFMTVGEARELRGLPVDYSNPLMKKFLFEL